MVKLHLYVEGGGDGLLNRQYRQNFQAFLKKAGMAGKLPRVTASGSRRAAYDDYRNALSRGESAALLVDSEAPVDTMHQSGEPADWRPWAHLKARDKWAKPRGAADVDCHLMVQCMESWLLADRQTIASHFGQGFRGNALPDAVAIETIAKDDVMDGLKASTRDCANNRYNKGRHSFELLGKINPGNVFKHSPWAKRFIGHLETRMNA